MTIIYLVVAIILMTTGIVNSEKTPILLVILWFGILIFPSIFSLIIIEAKKII